MARYEAKEGNQEPDHDGFVRKFSIVPSTNEKKLVQLLEDKLKSGLILPKKKSSGNILIIISC